MIDGEELKEILDLMLDTITKLNDKVNENEKALIALIKLQGIGHNKGELH